MTPVTPLIRPKATRHQLFPTPMRTISWITIITAAYFLSVLLYIFYDSGSGFWQSYFWIVNLSMCISGYTFNFIKRKSDFEMSLILLIIFIRFFALLYYITGLIFNRQLWMGAHLFFLISFAVSSFIGIIFLRYKSWRR